MATFFRGAGIGTYWHDNDARTEGFCAWKPGMDRSLQTMIDHIKDGTISSPFISLTRSFSIARSYAVGCAHGSPTEEKPAFVYQIEIAAPLPPGLVIVDPVCEILRDFQSPVNGATYQHDGNADFLIGVIDRYHYQDMLKRTIHSPPPGGAIPRTANLSQELEAIICALRDAELLAIGSIPKNCVTKRYPITS